jgi:hypothetical protein
MIFLSSAESFMSNGVNCHRGSSIFDGFVKSPSVPLRSGIALHLRHCGVQPNYASFLRICVPGPAKRGRAFYEPTSLATFYETINL